jgi:hypothetical protein
MCCLIRAFEEYNSMPYACNMDGMTGQAVAVLSRLLEVRLFQPMIAMRVELHPCYVPYDPAAAAAANNPSFNPALRAQIKPLTLIMLLLV